MLSWYLKVSVRELGILTTLLSSKFQHSTSYKQELWHYGNKARAPRLSEDKKHDASSIFLCPMQRWEDREMASNSLSIHHPSSQWKRERPSSTHQDWPQQKSPTLPRGRQGHQAWLPEEPRASSCTSSNGHLKEQNCCAQLHMISAEPIARPVTRELK